MKFLRYNLSKKRSMYHAEVVKELVLYLCELPMWNPFSNDYLSFLNIWIFNVTLVLSSGPDAWFFWIKRYQPFHLSVYVTLYFWRCFGEGVLLMSKVRWGKAFSVFMAKHHISTIDPTTPKLTHKQRHTGFYLYRSYLWPHCDDIINPS